MTEKLGISVILNYKIYQTAMDLGISSNSKKTSSVEEMY